jgi:hypothetical protein
MRNLYTENSDDSTDRMTLNTTTAFSRSVKHLNLSALNSDGTHVSQLDELGFDVSLTPHGVQAAAPADGAKKSARQPAHAA